MKKFTLFLMLMLAMVSTSFAQRFVKVEIPLTTEAGQPGYISSPHDHAVINPNSQWDKGGVAALIDGDPNTHFHTAWENVPAGPHYFQVDLGEGNAIDKFYFDYIARGGDANYDFPSEFTIKGSNDDVNYELITRVDLSSVTSAGARYSSALLGGENTYRYLRFEVTNTWGAYNAGYRTYFHAAEFDLFAAQVAPECIVTYNYKQDGVLVGSVSHKVYEGDEFPALVSGLYGVTVNDSKPSGTVTEDCECDIDVTIGEMPFEYFASVEAVENANGWYNLIMHSNWNTGDGTGKYRTYVGKGDDTTLAWGTERSLINPSDDYFWAFVGDPINGFSVVNKGAGEGYILSSNSNSTNPVLKEVASLNDGYNTTWKINARKYDVSSQGDYILEGAWFCLKHTSDWYMNANASNGIVGFWEDNDNGSGILAVKPLEINAVADVATYYSDNYVKIPSTLGATVYYVNKVEDGCAKLEQITGDIPAQTGVVVKYTTDANVVYAPEITSAGTTAAIEGNMLKGSTKKTLITKEVNNAYYALGLIDGVAGFYNAVNGDNEGEFYNNAYKAYLEIEGASETAAFYGFDWEGTTGVENVEVESAVNVIYDLTGRRVEAITAPGIYIVGGKKVLVK